MTLLKRQRKALGRASHGVTQESVNLDSGRVSVTFKTGQRVRAAALWKAAEAGGFTPVKDEIGYVVYEGPKP